MSKLYRDAHDFEAYSSPRQVGVPPGKRTLTQAAAAQPVLHRSEDLTREAVARVSSPRHADIPVDYIDPFALHLYCDESAAAPQQVGPVMRAATSTGGARDDNGVAAGADVAVARAGTSSGTPLPAELRGRFESSLGADLSGVRVHTGSASAEASAAVGARAYTVGQDIHFGSGHYDPSSSSGQLLLAHEVAHTVQQQGKAPSMQPKLEVSTPQDSAELEADRAAAAMVAGERTFVGSAGSGTALRRKAEGSPAGASSDSDAAVSGSAPPASPQIPSWYQHQSNANKEGEIEARIYFGTDSAELTPDDLAAIEELVKRWDGQLQSGDWELEVLGYADQRHTEAHNFHLSAKRAAKVKDAIEQRLTKGLPSHAEHFGEGETPSSNNPDDLARSRRVEIRVRRRATATAEPAQPEKKQPWPGMWTPAGPQWEPGPEPPSYTVPPDYSTEWELNVEGSVGAGLAVVGGEVASLKITNLKTNQAERFVFTGGGLGVSAVPIGGSGKGGPFRFTTSAPVPTKAFGESIDNWHIQAAAGAPGMAELCVLLQQAGLNIDANTISGELWILTGPRKYGANVVFINASGLGMASPNAQVGGSMGPLH